MGIWTHIPSKRAAVYPPLDRSATGIGQTNLRREINVTTAGIPSECRCDDNARRGIMTSLEERVECRKISSDECDAFDKEVAFNAMKLNYCCAKWLMEHKQVFEVFTGKHDHPVSALSCSSVLYFPKTLLFPDSFAWQPTPSLVVVSAQFTEGGSSWHPSPLLSRNAKGTLDVWILGLLDFSQCVMIIF